MPPELSAYHRRIADANRATILAAAMDLFLESGYDRTSLARVATAAGVSKATLFKQFPTKAELFEATVLAAADTPATELQEPPVTDFEAGLVTLGRAYVELLGRPGIENLIRVVIAESPRFPELRERIFDFGTLSVISALGRFLTGAVKEGFARIEDPGVASAQFLGMISTVVFWPRLIHGQWSLSDAEADAVVLQAARTLVARFGNPDGPDPGHIVR